MKRSFRIACLALIPILFFAAFVIHAGWLQMDVPVCTAPYNQTNAVSAPDGAGGAFITWIDAGASGLAGTVFMQRLDSNGNPLWSVNGVAVSPPRSSEQAIMSDGLGGAFLAFRRDSIVDVMDCFGDLSPIVIERIDGSGSLLWRKAINPHFDWIQERNVRLFPDGSGGAIVVWLRFQFDYYYCVFENPDLLMQRIDANGNRLWGLDPVRLSFNYGFGGDASVAQDDSLNVYVAWRSDRGANTTDIYAQKIGLDGRCLWSAEGVHVISSAQPAMILHVVPDGEGGAIVAWERLTPCCGNVIAQRIDAFGAPRWNAQGVDLSGGFSKAKPGEFGMVPHEQGGAVVFWTGGAVPSVFAQRVDSTGVVLWGSYGKQISDGINPSGGVRAIPDGSGGVVFAWQRAKPKPYENAIMGLWGTSSQDVFAVGDGGLILHYDGAGWSTMSSPTGHSLRAVWGTSPTNVYAVGEYGTVIHYNGAQWHLEFPYDYGYTFRGIWGSGPNDIWYVGHHDRLGHWDGSTWSIVAPGGASAFLYGIHGTSSSNIYVVGEVEWDIPLIAHYDGSTWTKTTGPGGTSLGSIWVSTDNHVFVGGGETFMHNDGSGWRSIDLDSRRLASIWGEDPANVLWGTDANNVYALLDGGYVAHWNGASLSTEQAATDNLYAIWGTGGSDVWVGGNSHWIRHHENGGWVTQNLLDSDVYVNRVDGGGQTLWTAIGAPASVNPDFQTGVSLCPDGAGNAILAWADSRNGSWDIYARKLSISRGPLVATELSRFEAGPVGLGLRVSWELSKLDEEAAFIVSRSAATDPSQWSVVSPAIERKALSFSFIDAEVEPGRAYHYRVMVADGAGQRLLFETQSVSAGLLPLALHQNAPNPFNPSTTIRYDLPAKCRVSLDVYDVSGRFIVRLVDARQETGRHAVEWSGTNAAGRRVASGVYIYRLTAGKETISRKMVLLR